MSLPVLALTMGDVNGIGPEILAKALCSPRLSECCRPLVIGSVDVLERARDHAAGCPRPVPVSSLEEALQCTKDVPVLECGVCAPPVRPGLLDPAAGHCAIEWVKQAVRWALEGAIEGLVTCPINKEAVAKAGHAVAGHTDLIAHMTGSPDYRMCLFADTLRVIHLTGHLSLRAALERVRTAPIIRSIELGHEALHRLGITRASIAVAGLNPHAGEAGAFGDEEIVEISPAVSQCRQAGINCSGPYPPDTVFRRMSLGEFDMVIAMYHDQGHIPMKMVAMDTGVNVTLGIPIVRTSVDHGTAFDIAWRGEAREQSLLAAACLAARLARTS
ncbi:MAG: 4-hydroxythreonine-4-phosphate dehydrogenase PdxA [Candidatus Hydrogenedentes bacterium]|nr:4-hydroxythreonine-4-phosphate dehydrogenase PdxA [Candidatus Hydrogenedentota bacterium]